MRKIYDKTALRTPPWPTRAQVPVESFGFWWKESEIAMWLGFGVASSRIEWTEIKYEFCKLLSAMRRYLRCHGAESSKEIEKAEFLVFQGAGDAHFGPERPKPMKTWRRNIETLPNRPSRIQWRRNYWNLYVTSGLCIKKNTDWEYKYRPKSNRERSRFSSLIVIFVLSHTLEMTQNA